MGTVVKTRTRTHPPTKKQKKDDPIIILFCLSRLTEGLCQQIWRKFRCSNMPLPWERWLAKQDGEGYVKKEITANSPSADFETSLREGGGTRDWDKESAYIRINRVTEGARRAVEKLWKDQICCFSRALSTASGPPLSRREVKGTLSVSPWLTPLPRERHIGIADFLSISADGIFVISASSTASGCRACTMSFHPSRGRFPRSFVLATDGMISILSYFDRKEHLFGKEV